jgi:hypothetical protein
MRLLNDRNADVRFRAALSLKDMDVSAPGTDNESLSAAAEALRKAHIAATWKKVQETMVKEAKP